MRVLFVIGQGGHGRVQVFAVLIHVPVLAPRDIGVVRVGKADGKAPRALILAAGIVIDLARGVIGDLIVVFHLVGNLGHACTGDGPHVVIPPIDPLTRPAVIGGPAEIGGVDVGGQAFLEPVQLIGANEMHLARQAGLIARAAQVVRIGRDGRGEFGGVVIDAGCAGQLARHETGPSGRAKGAGRIGVLKPRGVFGQTAQVRRVQPICGTIREQCPVQLVHHQDQNIGARRHAGVLFAGVSAFTYDLATGLLTRQSIILTCLFRLGKSV